MRFRLKTIVGIAFIEGLLLVVLVSSSMTYLHDSNEGELQRRASTAATLFATVTTDALLTMDLARMEQLAEDFLKNPDVVYVRIADKDRWLVQKGSAEALQRSFAPDSTLDLVNDGVYDTFSPIREAGQDYGRVELGLSVGPIQAVIKEARLRIMGLAILEMALVALFSWLLGSYLTRQLKDLTTASNRVAAGDFSLHLPIRGRDELADVAVAFNSMSVQLLKLYNDWQVALSQAQQRSVRLQAIVDSQRDGLVVTDGNGLITLFSCSAEQIFGYQAQEVMGRNVNALMPESDHGYHDQYLKNYHETGEKRVIESARQVKGLRKDGSVFIMDLSITELKTDDQFGFIGVVRDVTEIKLLESVREDTLNRLQKITSRVPGVVYEFLLRPDGSSCFPYASEGLLNIYRTKPADVLDDASKIFALIHPDDFEAVVASIQKSALDFTLWNQEYRVIFDNGDQRWLQGSSIPERQADGSTLWYGFISDITERKQIEEALKESENRFRSMADHAPVLIWIAGLDKLCYYFNKVWLDFTGKTLEQESGNGWAEGVHPDDFQRCLDTYVSAFDARQSFTMEYRLRRFDGEYRWLTDNGIPRYDDNGVFLGYIGSCVDITARKNIETKLRLSDVALQKIAQGILITDDKHNIVWSNAAFELTTGYTLAEITGQNCRFLQGLLTDKNKKKDISLALESNSQFFGEILNYRKDGATFWNELTILPIFNEENKLTNFMGVTRDVTIQKEAEAALIMGRDQAEHATLVKSQFLAMMSHEIRTPLNAILGAQELLANTDLAATQKFYLKMAVDAGNNLLLLVNDILDLTKVESGKLALENSDFDVVKLVKETVELVSIKARDKNLVVSIERSPDFQSWLNGDPLRFRQVLLNLLTNAVKFTETGGITVKLSLRPTEANDGLILFEVIDTGIGISQEVQGRLFDVFVQADLSDTRKYGGSGLGLAISKRLVELWGGHLGVVSNAGVGSCFWFTFGTAALAPNSGLMADQSAEEMVAPTTAKLLLVEDSFINQTILASMLRSAGHFVDVASSGAEAITAASENSYDLIFMDVSMPDMSGMDATEIIRKQGGTAATVPIIAITAHAIKGYQEMCLAAGMNGYATKPISQKDLLALVQQWCGPQTEEQVVSKNVETVVSNKEWLDVTVIHQLEEDYGMEKIPSLMHIFIDELEKRCDAIKSAIGRRDLITLNHEAHSIKSGSAIFGAWPLHDLAKETELCGYNDDLDASLIMAGKLLTCAKATMAAMVQRC
jgi:PAS domain S-box-containing protein